MDKSIDEEPKAKIAKKLIIPTRKYFLPKTGEEVDEKGLEDAIAQDTEEKDNDTSEE